MLNSVVDISHHNGNVNLKRAAEAGILGVIQKATQGEQYIDPTFKRNRARAGDAGLWFGAYHFGTGANGVSQARHFLSATAPDESTLVVLDFEDNPAGTTMSLEEARAFVTHIHAELGRWPGFYSGHTIKRALGTTVDPVLSNCWFWLAQYDRRPSCRRAGEPTRSGSTQTGVSDRSRIRCRDRSLRPEQVRW